LVNGTFSTNRQSPCDPVPSLLGLIMVEGNILGLLGITRQMNKSMVHVDHCCTHNIT